MRCRECDTPNPPERARCSKCNAKLPPPPGRAAPVEKEEPRAKPRRRVEVVEEIKEAEEVEPAPRVRRRKDEDEDRAVRRRRRREEEEDEDDDEEYDDEDDGAVSRIIPYHNAMALLGYYCAMFSLIPAVIYPLILIEVLEVKGVLDYLFWLFPVIGIILGGIGLVLGIIGMVQARSNRRAKGGGHAAFALFVGLITFLICALGWLLYAVEVFPQKLFG